MNFPITSTPSRTVDSGANTGGLPSVSKQTPPALPATAKNVSPDIGKGAPPNPADLEKELQAANGKLASDGREIRFEYDRDANKVIVRLVDTGTQEVLRQFPSNEALQLARLVNSGKPLLNILA